jgi:c(7)-type cytochrome triheme protein
MYGCNECHPDLFKAERGVNKATMEEMEKGQSCGACHDGSTAFGVAEACDSCHMM